MNRNGVSGQVHQRSVDSNPTHHLSSPPSLYISHRLLSSAPHTSKSQTLSLARSAPLPDRKKLPPARNKEGYKDGEGREQRGARQRQRPGGPSGPGGGGRGRPRGGEREAGGGACAGRGGAVGGAAAAVGADGADDGRGPRGVGVPGGGQHLPLGRHHRRLGRHRLRGHLLPPHARLPQRLPLQAAQGALRHPLLPPQRRHPRQHLPRHPPGQVVLRLRRPHHPALHPEPARRAEQRLAAQHAGGGPLGESGRVQEDGGEALQTSVVEEGMLGGDAAAASLEECAFT